MSALVKRLWFCNQCLCLLLTVRRGAFTVLFLTAWFNATSMQADFAVVFCGLADADEFDPDDSDTCSDVWMALLFSACACIPAYWYVTCVQYTRHRSSAWRFDLMNDGLDRLQTPPNDKRDSGMDAATYWETHTYDDCDHRTALDLAKLVWQTTAMEKHSSLSSRSTLRRVASTVWHRTFEWQISANPSQCNALSPKTRSAHLRLDGLMFYEAHITGLADSNPFAPPFVMRQSCCVLTKASFTIIT